MDIQRWLKETMEAGAPSVPVKESGSAFFQHQERARPVFEEKHARKRPKSDSSLLVPQPHSHVAPAKEPKLPIGKAMDASACSEASRPSRNDSTESESSSQRYARRPRRKTRPERYEPKPNKERGRHIHQSRKDESKKSRRQSKRKKGEKSDSGVAQSFHAKNVSRDRLTLKPREHLGLFNKGKTSTAVRGRGLPDLVFSEMKFLQKDQNQPEPAHPQSIPKKKRKKDHVHSKEGEISAFFTAVRPAQAEKDNNAVTNKTRVGDDAADPIDAREREQSTKSSGIVPTVELPGNGSYLGFGSRGPRHESTSYVSWSESARTPDMTPKHPKHKPAVATDHDDLSKRLPVGSTTTGADETTFKRPAPPTVAKQRKEESIERFQFPSMPLSQNRLSRSHSYPQPTSSPQKLNLVDRAAKIRSTESFASPSSMPPHIHSHTREESRRRESPRVSSRSDGHKETYAPATEQVQGYFRNYANDKGYAGTTEQSTSSDLGRVIQQCNQTFHAQRRATEPHRSRLNTDPRRVDNERNRTTSHQLPATATRRPTVRFSEVEQFEPRIPNFPGRSIYQGQVQRVRVPMQGLLDEDELLDETYLAEQEMMYQQGDMMYTEPAWEEHFVNNEPPSYVDDFDATTYGLEDARAPVHAVQRLPSDNSIVAPGFWRPNRLY